MIWDVNGACPGHFLQIFKPLVNVTFISNSSRELFAKNALKVYPNSRDGFERTLLNYDVNLIIKRRTWWNIELAYWEQLHWIREIDSLVETFVYNHDVCNMASMHIRKTDMELELNSKKRSGDDHYFKWVDKRPLGQPVYLMTDNPDTHRTFVQKYGSEKIRIFANISSVEQQIPVVPTVLAVSATNNASNNVVKTAPQLAVDHRFTTLKHAIVDVLIAARARDFRPAPFSSVSDLVRMMNFLHRWKWCGCAFRGC